MLLAARSAPGSGDINQTAKKLLQKLLITHQPPPPPGSSSRCGGGSSSRNHPSHSPAGGSRDTERRPGNILPHTLQKSPFIAKSAVFRKIGNNRPLPGEARQQHSAAALWRTLLRWRGEHKVYMIHVCHLATNSVTVFLFSHPLQFIPALPHHNCCYPHMLVVKLIFSPRPSDCHPHLLAVKHQKTQHLSCLCLLPLLSLSISGHLAACGFLAWPLIISHYSSLLIVIIIYSYSIHFIIYLFIIQIR